MTTCKAARRYLRTVNKHLTCSKKNRARLLNLTNRAIAAWLVDDEPDKSYSALVCAIGEPELFAKSLLARIPVDELETIQKKRRFQFCAILVSIALTMIAVFTVLTGFYLKYQDAMRGDYIVYEISAPIPKDVTIDEFKQYMNEYDRKIMEEIEKNEN